MRSHPESRPSPRPVPYALGGAAAITLLLLLGACAGHIAGGPAASPPQVPPDLSHQDTLPEDPEALLEHLLGSYEARPELLVVDLVGAAGADEVEVAAEQVSAALETEEALAAVLEEHLLTAYPTLATVPPELLRERVRRTAFGVRGPAEEKKKDYLDDDRATTRTVTLDLQRLMRHAGDIYGSSGPEALP